jgi:hypothetical protein
MTPKSHRANAKTKRNLGAAVAAALAVKVVALTVIYFAFFVPPAPPNADRTATAVFGLHVGVPR